jgi:hypothetical protein
MNTNVSSRYTVVTGDATVYLFKYPISVVCAVSAHFKTFSGNISVHISENFQGAIQGTFQATFTYQGTCLKLLVRVRSLQPYGFLRVENILTVLAFCWPRVENILTEWLSIGPQVSLDLHNGREEGGFPTAMPSAVTSTVDHPLGSPSPGNIQSILGNIQSMGTFSQREHSVNFREHSVNFREHSVNFGVHRGAGGRGQDQGDANRQK